MADTGKQWFCMVGEQRYGPIGEGELMAWAAQGRIRTTDTVWTEGMADWQPLGSVAYMFRGGLPIPAVRQAAVLAPHRGTLILVLGIVGLVVNFFGIPGAIAWYLANQDLPQMASGRMDPAGQGMTQAGKVCGIIGVAMGILGCCITAFWMAMFFGFAGSGMGF